MVVHVKSAHKQDSIRVGTLERECAWKLEIASKSLKEAEQGGQGQRDRLVSDLLQEGWQKFLRRMFSIK